MRLARVRLGLDCRCNVSRCHVRWLGLVAFSRVLRRQVLCVLCVVCVLCVLRRCGNDLLITGCACLDLLPIPNASHNHSLHTAYHKPQEAVFIWRCPGGARL